MQTVGLYGSMLQDHYREKLAAVMAERRERFAKIRTAKAARAYIAEVRAKYRAALTPLPRRTALKARVVGSETLAGVKIDRVLFESRPDFPVTANFYCPEKHRGKLPAVLGMIGHEQPGILWKSDQAFAMNLARKGFAVLLVDPAGQGERGQYEPMLGVGSKAFPGCTEHNFCNKILLATGDAFCNWRVWDGVRALDYLLSRPEVDPAHVGVTGCSGGGTMTTYMWAFDDRLTMAAPSCYITSFMRNFDNELPVDGEQVIPGLAGQGFEMADFLIARAPDPVVILAQDNDFFDPRGTAETFADVAHIYRLLGAEDRARLVFGEGPHTYGVEAREQMYGFFTEFAFGKRDARETVSALPGNTVQVTPKGRTIKLKNARTIPDFAADRIAAYRKRAHFGEPAAIRRYLAREMHVVPPSGVPDFQVLRPYEPEPKKVISRFGVRTEPGIRGFLHVLTDDYLFRIPPVGEATLYAAGEDAEAELLDGRAAGRGLVFALDVRGVGASRPTTTDRREFDLTSPYAAEYFYDAAGLMLNDPLPGGRARDVLAAMKLLHACGVETLHLAGRGLGALAAAMAAAASGDDGFATVTLYNAPVSLAAMCSRGRLLWPQSAIPRDLLKVADLPDLYSMLNAHGIELVEPLDDEMKPMTVKQIRRDLGA